MLPRGTWSYKAAPVGVRVRRVVFRFLHVVLIINAPLHSQPMDSINYDRTTRTTYPEQTSKRCHRPHKKSSILISYCISCHGMLTIALFFGHRPIQNLL